MIVTQFDVKVVCYSCPHCEVEHYLKITTFGEDQRKVERINKRIYDQIVVEHKLTLLN